MEEFDLIVKDGKIDHQSHANHKRRLSHGLRIIIVVTVIIIMSLFLARMKIVQLQAVW